MQNLINTLVAEYKANNTTWHDIQDQVEAWVIQQDGYGTTMNWEVMRVRWVKTNMILNEIEKQVKGGDQ